MSALMKEKSEVVASHQRLTLAPLGQNMPRRSSSF